MDELHAFEDPRVREVDGNHGDDHALNLGQRRALTMSLGTQPVLAGELWETNDKAARLLAILIGHPTSLGCGKLNTMLRVQWFADPDPVLRSTG